MSQNPIGKFSERSVISKTIELRVPHFSHSLLFIFSFCIGSKGQIVTTYYLKYYFALFLRRRHVIVKGGRLMETQDTLPFRF